MNLIFAAKSLLVTRAANGDAWYLPNSSQLQALSYQPSLIQIDGVNILGSISSDIDLSPFPELRLVNLRQALNFFGMEMIEKIIHAEQMLFYQSTHRYCGSCGQATSLSTAGKWLHCSSCEHEIYPRISPAMIVAITRGNQLLMAQANNFAPEVWSVLAGFCEVGESLEQTVHREVFEEVGIKIKNVQYWGSQYWPFPNSLMVGFTAEYESGEIVLDTNEMRTAGFFTKDEIPGRPSTHLSIASRLIDDFIAKH
ncbi:MAG: NAD(+) diphosphatase [Burkholderiales bacterium]|nr:NAD(+) diphosphatase [Burkholderiales bacterium]